MDLSTNENDISPKLMPSRKMRLGQLWCVQLSSTCVLGCTCTVLPDPGLAGGQTAGPDTCRPAGLRPLGTRRRGIEPPTQVNTVFSSSAPYHWTFVVKPRLCGAICVEPRAGTRRRRVPSPGLPVSHTQESRLAGRYEERRKILVDKYRLGNRATIREIDPQILSQSEKE